MIGPLELLGRLLLAALLGSVIGRERVRVRVRVKRFIVQQSDDDPDTDDISVSFSRTRGPEFDAICETLKNLACVRACRPESSSRSFA